MATRDQQDAAVRQKIAHLEKHWSICHSSILMICWSSWRIVSACQNYCTCFIQLTSDNPLLNKFDSVLRQGLLVILNMDLSNTQWLQASLPVRQSVLGIRSACMLAPSPFLASAAYTHVLEQSVLPQSMRDLQDETIPGAETSWTSLSGSERPAPGSIHF